MYLQICDYDLKIFGVLARYGGATHDSYIWQASQISTLLEQRYDNNNEERSWLLGNTMEI